MCDFNADDIIKEVEKRQRRREEDVAGLYDTFGVTDQDHLDTINNVRGYLLGTMV